MLKIAVCQLPLDIEDVKKNIALASAAIHDASVRGAKLVVLPELTNSGYVFRNLAELKERATTLDGAIIKEWISLAGELDLVLVAGLAIKDEGGYFNCSVIIDSSGASLKPVQDGLVGVLITDDNIDCITVAYSFDREKPRGVHITVKPPD